MQPKYKIGDLVVNKYTTFDSSLNICAIIGIEFIDENHEYWMEGYDEYPYYLYEGEVVFTKSAPDHFFMYKRGDFMCFEDDDSISIEEFFMQEELTLDDYIDIYYNGKDKKGFYGGY